MRIKSESKNFSKNLRLVRKKFGLSQEEMAEKLHTTKQTIFRYERGDILPGLNILKYLIKNFNVDINWLLNEVDDDNADMFIQPKPDSYGIYEEEKKEMDYLMDYIPFVRSSVLKHFILFKHENKEEITKFLEENDLVPFKSKG